MTSLVFWRWRHRVSNPDHFRSENLNLCCKYCFWFQLNLMINSFNQSNYSWFNILIFPQHLCKPYFFAVHLTNSNLATKWCDFRHRKFAFNRKHLSSASVSGVKMSLLGALVHGGSLWGSGAAARGCGDQAWGDSRPLLLGTGSVAPLIYWPRFRQSSGAEDPRTAAVEPKSLKVAKQNVFQTKQTWRL